jgi:glycosyltransferase involved in cell wall biosynthesis
MGIASLFPECKFLAKMNEFATAEARNRIRKYLASNKTKLKSLVTLSHLGYVKCKNQEFTHIVDVPLAHPFFVNKVLWRAFAKLGLTGEFDKHTVSLSSLKNEHESIVSADVVTVPSTFVKNTLLDAGIIESKIRLIPYGCNFGSVSKLAIPVLPETSFRILFVGSLCVRKGLHVLLEAFSALEIPGKELVLVGPKTWETERILKLYPNENVNLVGKVLHSKIMPYFSSSHVFVLPSLAEGQAMVLGEAISFGLPIIATSSTGIADLIPAHMKCCFIIEDNDPQSLLAALRTVAGDPEKLASMRSSSLAAKYSISGWDNYSANWARLINEIRV